MNNEILTAATLIEPCTHSPSFKKLAFGKQNTHMQQIDFAIGHLPRGIIGLYMPEYELIILSSYFSSLGSTFLSNILTHEMRHAWQSFRKLINRDIRAGALRQQIIRNRLIESDAIAFSLTCAWEAKQNGHPDLWNDWQKNANIHGKNAYIAFTNALAKNPNAARDGSAQNAVLLSWKNNPLRAETYDFASAKGHKQQQRTPLLPKAKIMRLHLCKSDFEKALFDMAGDTQRSAYGKFTLTQRKKIETISPAALRILCDRLDTLSRHNPTRLRL